MTGRRRVALASTLGLVAILAVASASNLTLARFADADTTGGTFASDTLAPPTALAATGGSSVGLTWTPTVDAYATGYSVWRGSVSGGPYTNVGSVTPRTATSTTDGPALGTWFYVLRSTFGSWSSVASAEASATVGPPSTTTAYVGCASQAADVTGAGDNDGYQTAAAQACTDGGLSARDPDSGTGGTDSCGSGTTPDATKDRHRFWGFATGLPGSVSTIAGIRVRADVGLNNNAGDSRVCAQLSWDGGASWTAIKSIAVSGPSEATYLLGGTADTWGRSWTRAEFASGVFVVRIIDASTRANKAFELDYLAVSVTYLP